MTLLIIDLNREQVRKDGKYSPDIDKDYVKIIEDNELQDAIL